MPITDNIRIVSSMGPFLTTEMYASETRVGLSNESVYFMAHSIINREIDVVRRRNPSLDLNKIQEMIDSEDREMILLGYSILQNYTKYTSRLLELIKEDNAYEVGEIVREYIRLNRTNITDNII